MKLKRLNILQTLAVIGAVLILIVANCPPGLAATEEANGLRLSIDFNKACYVLGEPIIVRLSISNVGTEPITERWFAYTRGFYLDLENAAGTRVGMEELESEKEQIITDVVCALQPGETVSTAFDLTRGDIAASSPFFPKLARILFPTEPVIREYVVKHGTYRLFVMHRLQMNKSDGEVPACMKASKEFTVLPPNDEQTKALVFFETIPRFDRAGAEASQANALADYDLVWKQYRSTPFAPYALYYSARILQRQGDLTNALAKYSELRQACPDFPLIADLLYYQATALIDAGKASDAKAVASLLESQFSNHLVSPDVATKEKGSPVRLLLDRLR